MRSKIIYSTECLNHGKHFSILNNVFSGFGKRMKENQVLLFINSVNEFFKVNNDLVFCLESSMHLLKGNSLIAIKNVANQLKRGVLFSKALHSAGIFPDYVVKIIKSGEKNNNLKETIELLKSFLTWNIEQKQGLKSALFYPVFTFLVFIGITFMFSNYIVPSIASVVESINSTSANNYKIFNALIFVIKSFFVIISAFFAFVFALKNRNRVLFEKIVKKIPVLGQFLVYRSVYITSYYISSSMNNNISLLDSLSIAIDSVSGITKNILIKVRENVEKGESLHKSLKRFSDVPEIVVQMIETGEKSFNLSSSMDMLKNMFYSNYKNKMDKLIKVLPMILVSFTALLMISFVMLIFTPLYSLGF